MLCLSLIDSSSASSSSRSMRALAIRSTIFSTLGDVYVRCRFRPAARGGILGGVSLMLAVTKDDVSFTGRRGMWKDRSDWLREWFREWFREWARAAASSSSSKTSGSASVRLLGRV